ncbi:alpha-L-rhamnosidase [Lactiplantibacillus modestisalitolerans]|uniref:alpha-L-rhamnosidase n=1 Tax=Lactiplantibacillus modestisalitolerans TaxID=1457219 RepID=A0ABV5WSW9_9LACO|nr:alpha-L-rhamnosidase [Lactiplantibacillus modestisalitolerans]
MQISDILVNHMHAPLGFQLDNLRLEFKVTAAKAGQMTKQLTIWATDANQPLYQTTKLPYDNNYFDVEMALQPRTQYHAEITVQTAAEQTSATTTFETGKMAEAYSAKWIANADKDLQNTLFKRNFETAKAIQSARLYVTGLGVYEAYLDHQKVGDEYLAPGSTDYRKWVQVQTYDVTEPLQTQTNHELLISTGDGWYKGTFGFDGGQECIYGDQQMALAELHLTYTDGTQAVINTDDQWQTTRGRITKSAIYYGEDLDDTLPIGNWQPVTVLTKATTMLEDRLSLPIKIQETLPAKELIETPAKEQVLDFRQNQAGWLEFYNTEPKGTKLTFQMGEILQKGNFYRDNLRAARASFTYVSDGQAKWVRPHFTYFGYRYVKVTGNTQPLELKNFRAAVMYSDMALTGSIQTDNAKVNRLFQNVLWGQKSNFFDVPTDCPQRDERLGWTGDADIFSNTAALNMNVYPFFKKYAKDMAVEQAQHAGMLTMYAPAMGVDDGGAAVWGDAATIIPWNMYQTYGDPAIIKQNYASMKAWVDWITANTKTANLWTGMFQFGDWIALDGENPALPTGKTDEDFIASVYYAYSSEIVAKSAQLTGHKADAAHYAQLAADIRAAIQNEYITANGRLSIDTQTAYALTLYFKLVPESQLERVVSDLVARLKKDNDHLQTGFVGTPFICQVLSKYGHHDLATKIFMLEDFPSWLYAVNMGATTVWERWNSVETDGSMNPDGMNSLNHYSIGAIMEWGYKYLLGIDGHTPGYQEVTLKPNFNYRLKQVAGHFDTPYGDLQVAYQVESDAEHRIQLTVTVPVGVTAHVDLPRATDQAVQVNQQAHQGGQFDLTAGTYTINYVPTQDYVGRYNAETPAKVILQDAELTKQIDQIDPVLDFFRNDPSAAEGGLGTMSLTKLNTLLPFINVSADHLAAINQLLAQTPLLSERTSK